MYSVAPITVDGIPVGVVIFGYEDAVPVDALAPADDPLSIRGSSASGSLGDDGSAPAHYGASAPATGKTEPKVTPHIGSSGDIHTGTYGPGRPRESVNTAPHVVETDSPHDVKQHHTVTDTPHESTQPPRDVETPHEKPKHITTDDIKALGHPADDHRQPEFRPGRIPLGKDKAVAPPKFSVEDVQKAVKGNQEKLPHYTTDDIKHASMVGGIDRSRFKEELEKKPWLYKKMAWMVSGEVMGHATKEARMAQLETAFNRATKRNQSLEHVLQSVSEGKQGYYAGHGAPGGGTYAPSKEPSDASVDKFKNEIAAPVLAGSNYARGMSGNASGAVAAHQIAKGTPHYNMNSQGGDILFDEDAHRGPLPRLPGAGVEKIDNAKKPVGVTRLGPDHPATPSTVSRGTPGAAIDAGAMNAATGKPPLAFIMHHTGGGGSVEGLKNTLNNRGLGVEYAMDREGNITQIGKPGAANIMPESRYRKTPILGEGHPFLTNKNIVGMEVIANNNADVTQKQVEAGVKFLQKYYPNTPVFGHGQVNPGHKEPDEGKKITDALNRSRNTIAGP